MTDNENTQDTQSPGNPENPEQTVATEAAATPPPLETPGGPPPPPGVSAGQEITSDPIRAIASDANLGFLLDVPLQVSVELGRCHITISDLLELGKGTVLELEKIAGEPLDFRVNNRLVARGEAVVVNDKFGVRLTDIISPSERVKNLK